MAAGKLMKRIHTAAPKAQRERPWLKDLPADPRDPDVVRAKAHIFHELHADGRNAQCAVCDSQYRTA